MRRLTVFAAALALAIVTVGLFAGVPAAQTRTPSSSSTSPVPLPPERPDDALATVQEDAEATLLYDAKVWAQEAGIPVEEAERRLRLQDKIGELDLKLMTNERDTYAGLWIKYEPDYGVVARFTRNGEQTIRPYVEGGPLENLVEVRPASATLPQLAVAQEKARRLVDFLGVPAESGIEVEINSAYVNVTDQTRLASALQAANLSLPDEVMVREVDQLLQPSEPSYAGFKLNPIGWPNEYNCTSGFTVRHIPTDDEGTTTAGHCKDDMRFRGTYFPKRNGAFYGPYDFQWHNTPGYEDRAWIRDFSDDATPGFRYVRGARGRLDQPEGSRVCHFGTGGDIPELTCGTIQDRSFNPEPNADYNNATATFVLVTSSGDLVDLGDSGGPWFDENIALGIQSGGNWNAPGNTDGRAFYMSITYLDNDGPEDFNLFVQKVD